MGKQPSLTHLDETGAARMVDVSAKAETAREAVAEGFVSMSGAALEAIRTGQSRKGDVIATARIAGIMAAKKTADLIPLCHPLPISAVSVEIGESADGSGLQVTARVRVAGQTGVEMEALTAASVACLTIYDMAKAIDKAMVIGPVRLLEKRGGKSGDWRREGA